MSSNSNGGSGDGGVNEHEEDECRVCRSNDERELYSPCKCSGSVGTDVCFFSNHIIIYHHR